MTQDNVDEAQPADSEQVSAPIRPAPVPEPSTAATATANSQTIVRSMPTGGTGAAMEPPPAANEEMTGGVPNESSALDRPSSESVDSPDPQPDEPEMMTGDSGGTAANIGEFADDVDDGTAQVAMPPTLTLPEPQPCEPAPEPDHIYAQSVMSQTRERIVDLCDYRGRVLLIVNTAAQCGFTPQYEQLAELDNLYRQRGLSILGFLTDDFGNQGGNADQVEDCIDDYQLRFEQFEKVGVTPNSRQGQHPVFAWLTSQQGFLGAVSWNFNKFLVSGDGRLLGRWNQFVSPASPEVKQLIENALNESQF
ncbi:MAG: hypothetical protein VX589_16135 [Myxococcota bacterium]|nr:hypothetical protein [Myxococcota bacterium]